MIGFVTLDFVLRFVGCGVVSVALAAPRINRQDENGEIGLDKGGRMKVFTIGAYGWDEEDFVQAIRNAAPDVFVDVRRRRGLRGRAYAWANSTRLQAMLADSGIPYVHRLDVAPSDATRHIVARDANSEGIGYRDRTSLSQEYLDAYGQEVLETFDAAGFMASLGESVESLMLFCVERVPAACHRSLLAERLAGALGAEVMHIVPPDR